ncbi:insulinase family protein [Candidatus Kaiserbacteria bacterium]|nr:insulinase family protein [Candidatus Kaiserbacteria bacterium]
MKANGTQKGKRIAGFRHVRTVQDIREFELAANGLRVLHMRIPGSGTVTANIVYLVGSRHEERGRTGLAHMFEHMLFKTLHDGTGRPVKESGFKRLEDAGAISNATTWLDRTNYFFTIPRAYLKDAFDYEASRMRNLLFDNKEFLPERANVVSEYEMHAGIPLDALETAMAQAAYVSHGYGHDTIGHKPDIQHMTLDSLKDFYDTYYWPNNAVLTVVGDIEETEALRVVQASFGSLPRSPKPVPEIDIIEPAQEGERRVEIARKNPINIYAVGYKAPRTRHFDWAVMQIIAAYLSEGPQSRLDDTLVDTHKASSADCALYPTYDEGLFMIVAQITAGSSHEEVSRIIDEEIARLAAKPIDKKRLETLKTMILADELYSRDGTYAVSRELTECIAVGDWTRFYTLADDIRRVSVADVQKTARQYFQKNRRTVGLFVGQTKKT